MARSGPVVCGWPAAVRSSADGPQRSGRLRMARSSRLRMARSSRPRMARSSRPRMARSGRPRMARSGRLRTARSGRLRMACPRFTVPDGRRGKLGWIRVSCALAGFRPLWSAARPWSCGSSVSAGLPTSTTVHSAHFQKKEDMRPRGRGGGCARVRVSVVGNDWDYFSHNCFCKPAQSWRSSRGDVWRIWNPSRQIGAAWCDGANNRAQCDQNRSFFGEWWPSISKFWISTIWRTNWEAVTTR